MTDELVKRLRSANDESFVETLCGEAADHIEQLTAERDEAWAMVAKADTQMGQSLADYLQAKVDNTRLREALIELIQQTHNCERELTEDLHHVDFCGESVPLTNAREALKGGGHE